MLKVFALFDDKALVYGVPFFMQSEGLAVRAFTELANDPKSQVSKYPEDFTLKRIGCFDEHEGKLIPEKPTVLGNALAFRRPVEPPAALPLDLPAMPSKGAKIIFNGVEQQEVR